MTRFTVDSCVETTPLGAIQTALRDPGFGRYFTDHLALATWKRGRGWYNQQITGQLRLPLHPGAAVLQYGQEIFEGMKAYRHADRSVWLFRPEMNAVRFARSAQRMAMPQLPLEHYLDSINQLVDLDRDWVPEPDGEQSLYIRPFMIASETLIGVREANEFTYLVIASPVGPYYPDPLKLWVTPNFSRSAVGGTATAKCGGNYAGSMAGEREVHEQGCSQVLWLDSAERTYVEEGGTMNFLMITADGELVTPDLQDGTILAGVTRDSLLQLAPDHSLKPVERKITLAELRAGVESGRVTELLCCGTAAVVSPVIGLKTPDWQIAVGDGKPGAETMELRDHLTGIQFGRYEDKFGWTHKVERQA